MKKRFITFYSKIKGSNLYRIEILSLVLTGFAICIVVVFVGRIWGQYSILSSENISMPATGNTGDFIGGVVGTVLSFVGVLLFYVALRIQQQELSQQRTELTNQRLEFKINRCTNAIYSQISRVNSIIENSEIQLLTRDGPVRKNGYIGIMELNGLMRGTVGIIEAMPGSSANLSNELVMIESNYETIIRLVITLKSSLSVICKLLGSSNTSNNNDKLSQDDKNDLKYIFTTNIGEVVFKLLANIQVLLKHHSDYNIQGDDSEVTLLLNDSDATYLFVKNEIDKYYEELGKYGRV